MDVSSPSGSRNGADERFARPVLGVRWCRACGPSGKADASLAPCLSGWAEIVVEGEAEADAVLLRGCDMGCGGRRGAPGARVAEDEGGERQLLLREEELLPGGEERRHALTLLFALSGLRRVRRSRSPGDLVRFHAEHKYLLMACDPHGLRRMGRIVARGGRHDWDARIAEYRSALLVLLAEPPPVTRVINAVEHVFGYLSGSLSPAERGRFLALLEEYRAGRAELGAALRALAEWVSEARHPYLTGQRLLQPYPPELDGESGAPAPGDGGRGARGT